MEMSVEQQKGLIGHACPNYEPDFSGYCQECYQKADCMLRSILLKLERRKEKLG